MVLTHLNPSPSRNFVTTPLSGLAMNIWIVTGFVTSISEIFNLHRIPSSYIPNRRSIRKTEIVPFQRLGARSVYSGPHQLRPFFVEQVRLTTTSGMTLALTCHHLIWSQKVILRGRNWRISIQFEDRNMTCSVTVSMSSQEPLASAGLIMPESASGCKRTLKPSFGELKMGFCKPSYLMDLT